MIPDDALARLDVDQWEAHHRERLRTPDADAATFVAEDVKREVNRVVGLAICGRGRHTGHEGEAELAALYVEAEHHREGAGRALTQATLDHLGASGYTQVYLWVLEANAGAHAFYRRMGFVPTGEAQTLSVQNHEVVEVCWARPLA